MPDKDPNTTISLAMGKDDPAAWKDCSCMITKLTAQPFGDLTKHCPACSGKGKVATNWADPANTLRLVEWISTEMWKGAPSVKATERRYNRFRKALAEAKGMLATIDVQTHGHIALRIRDIIASALEGINHE